MSVTRCLRAHVKKAGLEPLPSLAVVVFWAHVPAHPHPVKPKFLTPHLQPSVTQRV